MKTVIVIVGCSESDKVNLLFGLPVSDSGEPNTFIIESLDDLQSLKHELARKARVLCYVPNNSSRDIMGSGISMKYISRHDLKEELLRDAFLCKLTNNPWPLVSGIVPMVWKR